jgi:thiol-disulfide isomerase/thioredoxin
MNLAFFAAAVLSVAAPSDSLRPTGTTPSGDTMLLDFRADWCGPCRQMDPVVGSLLAEGFPVRRVNVDQERALATKYNVEGIPCFVMIVNGREVDRAVGVTDRSRLAAMFSRNGVGAGSNVARGSAPAINSSLAAAVPFPMTDRDSSFSGALPHPSRFQTDSIVMNDIPAAMPNPEGPQNDHLLRASVRLRIEDENGFSRGSGTIIDARNGEALIITCGHMFRDAAKDGRIWVDLFGPAAPQGVPGHLIDYDMKSEVGLMRIATTYPIQPAHLAPPGYVARSGDKVISMGCDGGADVTAKETHVTSINRYVGAPNLQVAFQPVQGRSGGGLFTPDGQVVGVCYAADPEASEGLFASLPALCAELDRVGLSFVYNGKGPDQINNEPALLANNQTAPRGRLLTAVKDPQIDHQVQPASMTTKALPDRKKQSLSPDEVAALQAIHNDAQGADVVCIVRPQGAPAGASEIIVVNHASPGLLKQLTGEQELAQEEPGATISR